jgi:hypothetical protein
VQKAAFRFLSDMERLSGTRYAYRKTRVAYLVPFVVGIPGLLLLILIFLLRARFLSDLGFLAETSLGVRLLALVLALFGLFVAWDLWSTFLRTLTEEIWITDRDIVWIGPRQRVLLKALHHEVVGLVRLGRHPDEAWRFAIQTSRGKIPFTAGLEHADELIGRIESFLERRDSL